MADSKYFGIPFGTSGDKTTIPEAVQPSGAISYTQGFGPDYERDPETDPLAKRVPRDETNELYFQVTNALKFLQLYGTPEWYATDGSGNPVSYPLSARVRYDAGAGMQAWRSLVASNTATPGSDATKWALDNPFDLVSLEASLTEALAGTLGTKIITPRRLASASQRGTWNYAVAAGTVNARTVTLSPAPAALTAGFTVRVNFPAVNTGAATLNVNGLGATQIVNAVGTPLSGGELNGVQTLVFDGTNFVLPSLSPGQLIAVRRLTVSGTYTPTPGTNKILVKAIGGGGAGGGGFATSSGSYAVGSGGASGSYGEKWVTSGFSSVSYTIGAGGVGVSGAAGGSGGTTSFGALLSCPGGGGGPTATISTTSSSVSNQGAPGAGPTGADFGYIGHPGQCGFIFAGFGPVSGQGAASEFGSGGTNTAGGTGGPGRGFGSGAGGNANNTSQGNTVGPSGAPGYIEVWEYA